MGKGKDERRRVILILLSSDSPLSKTIDLRFLDPMLEKEICCALRRTVSQFRMADVNTRAKVYEFTSHKCECNHETYQQI